MTIYENSDIQNDDDDEKYDLWNNKDKNRNNFFNLDFHKYFL